MKEEKVLNIKFKIMAIICICIFAIAIVPKELQNDTFYTIKLGELILENGIDMKEHFAWHEGLPYTYPHWLYDVIMYLVFMIGGYNGLYISTIVLSAVLGIAIYLTNAKLTKNNVIPFFTTILIMYFGKGFLAARAQLITFILFVLEIYYIERFLETKKKRFAVGLLIIPALIANIHAAVFPFYFILYLPYIGEFAISGLVGKDILTKLFLKVDRFNIKMLEKKEKLNEKKQKELELLRVRVEKNQQLLDEKQENKTEKEPYKIIVKDNKNVVHLIGLMILALTTGLLTPIGDTPYTYLIYTMQGTTTQNISEHLPIILYNSTYVLGFIVIAICLISFTKVKVKLSDLFLLGGLIFLTIMARRQQSMLFFVGILVVNRIVCILIEMYAKDGTAEILKYLTSIVAKIITYTIFVAYTIFALYQIKDEEIVSNKTYPIEAVEYVKENLDIDNIRLFNEYNFGSYLLYNDIPVFIDSRADVYDPAFKGVEKDIFRDFMNLTGGCNDYEEKMEEYGITHLLIYRNTTLEKILRLDDNYNELYKDDRFIIYERLSAIKGEDF